MSKHGVPAELGTCRRCEEDVIWQLLASGRYSPPLTEAEPVLVLLDERVVSAPRLIAHRCDPEKKAKVSARRREWDARKREMAESFKAQERDALREVGRNDCPSCGARAGDPCANLSRGSVRSGKPNRWPHRERVSESYARLYLGLGTQG